MVSYEKIANLDFKDISLTTNGVLLEKYAEDLKNAGLDRVNVSLDTLNRDTYKFVTNKDYLEKAKSGILKAVDVGLYPVKINMVIMKDIWTYWISVVSRVTSDGAEK